MKLNPDDLFVTSFEPADPEVEAQLATAAYALIPTPATRCFICPPITYDCA